MYDRRHHKRHRRAAVEGGRGAGVDEPCPSVASRDLAAQCSLRASSPPVSIQTSVASSSVAPRSFVAICRHRPYTASTMQSTLPLTVAAAIIAIHRAARQLITSAALCRAVSSVLHVVAELRCKREEADTHKSAKTYACNVFVSRDLDL